MKITKTEIEDLIIIEPEIFRDQRGYFYEGYNKDVYFKNDIKTEFVQDNYSFSNKGTLRGLHYQLGKYSQAKLVQVLSGRVLDIAVDLRKESSTYGQHFKHILSGENKKQLYIPVGFAHGFLSLEDNTILNYKCSDYYNANTEASILWNDPNLAIDWGIDNPILAEKDQLAQNFITFENPF